MTAATLHGEDSSLASQCLALCQTLASQGKAFTFSLKIDSTFSFSLDTRESKASAPLPEALTRKKVSPSTKRRNSRRRAEFLRKKQSSLLAASSPASHPAAGEASAPAGSQQGRPLHILPSPSPSSGRRRVVSCVGRLEVPTFSNLDGAPPSPSPCSPSPSPSGGWPPTKDDVVRYHRMMSKENQCCLCNFRISGPSPDEGQLCGLLSSMWSHIEECHPDEEDWFDETFSSMFLDV